MGMIGNKKITADTDISELLDLEKVQTIFDNAYSKVSKELNNRMDDINTELNRGLSREAFSMNGCEGLYDCAVNTKTSQEQVISYFDSILNDVMSLAEEKRQEELTDLQTALNKKIKDLTAIIDGIEYNTGAYNQSCGAMGGDPI